ncbi:MAG TPA: endonuclease NucS [Candidatus Thermoplasmatota archaeon]|nr:endonuclease NucS [Candidatus Thermoplasmatota archaeon]
MSVRVLRDLQPEAAVEFLKSELGRKLVQVAARCSIDYQGRAESRLPSGERLLMFKPDGTLLVHTSTKLKPVNWQPPGCTFSAGREDGRIVLTALREKPKETVRIVLEDVQMVVALSLDDGESLDLVGTEDDLQAFLAQRPHLIEPGFKFWRRERASGRGPMDLYGEDANGRRVVVEVKRRAAGVKEADQLRRYVERERAARGDVPVRGILVAPQVSDNARKYLDDNGLESLELDWEKLRRTAADLLQASQRTLAEWKF